MKEYIIKNKVAIGIIALVIVIGIIWLFNNSGSSDGSAKSLAQCLKDKGAKFYGASWCPHCKSQKKIFGDAANLLPYIECADSKGGTAKECTDANVAGYPTWVFADGKRQSGEVSLAQLKQLSGC